MGCASRNCMRGQRRSTQTAERQRRVSGRAAKASRSCTAACHPVMYPDLSALQQSADIPSTAATQAHLLNGAGRLLWRLGLGACALMRHQPWPAAWSRSLRVQMPTMRFCASTTIRCRSPSSTNACRQSSNHQCNSKHAILMLARTASFNKSTVQQLRLQAVGREVQQDA